MVNQHLTVRLEFDKYYSWNGKNKSSDNYENNQNNSKSSSSCKHEDKSYAGDARYTFKKHKKDEEKETQHLHAGASKQYADEYPNYIKKNKSYSLFYINTNNQFLPKELYCETHLINGIGLIKNEGSVFEAKKVTGKDREGKIYCYSHYEKNELEKDEYTLFRFPFQELLAIKDESLTFFTSDCGDDMYKYFINKLPLDDKEKQKELKEKIDSIVMYNSKPSAICYFLIDKLKKDKKGVWDLFNELKENCKEKTKYKFSCQNDNIDKVIDNAIKNLSTEDTERIFFKYKSHLAPTTLILKYQDKLYEQIMLLKSNTSLWTCIQEISGKMGWCFADDEAIKFLRENREKLREDLENMKNPGLWGVCDYLKIKPADDLLKMCEEDNNYNKNYLPGISATNKKYQKNQENLYRIFTDYLAYYPLSGVVVKKIAIHLGINNFSKNNNKYNIWKTLPVLILDTDILGNPYILYENYIQMDDARLSLDDIDWGEKTRYKILSNYFAIENPYRLRAIVVEYIKKQEQSTGHVWISYADAEDYIIDKLIFLDDKCDKVYSIEELKEEQEFQEKFEFDEENKYLTTKKLKEKEKKIFTVLEDLISHDKSLGFHDYTYNTYIEQDIAIDKMQKLNFAFISGVAGSGKSHALCKYLDYLCAQKPTQKFQVLAPTGKAANVLKEKLKEEKNNKEFFPQAKKFIANNDERISTAHSFIKNAENSSYIYDLQTYIIDDDEPKDYDVLIIDEISMFTLDLLYDVLRVANPKKLIIFGDIKQLPPIGYGSLATSIYNFLDKQNHQSLSKMETSHRAGEDSKFIDLSIKLRNLDAQLTDKDLTTDKNNNLIVKKYNNFSTLQEHIKNIYQEVFGEDELKENLIKDANNSISNGDNLDNLQILAPSNIGEFGNYALNEYLRKKVQAKRENCENIKYIKLKNDNETGIVNGMFGVGLEKKIKFANDKEEDFSPEESNPEYGYGYAITIHKSQGSGFENVVLVLPKEKSSLITRELIYTALTRPKKRLYILYHESSKNILTDLHPMTHRNMALFEMGKEEWISYTPNPKYIMEYKGNKFTKKQDLYTALMLDFAGITFTCRANGTFEWEENNEDKMVNLKSYIKTDYLQIGDTDITEEQKVINLAEIYEIFNFKINKNKAKYCTSEVKEDHMEKKREKELKNSYIPPNERIKIITHNGLVTRSWSEAIIMLILDYHKVDYKYEKPIKDNNDKIILLPDFTVEKDGNTVYYEHLGMLNNMNYTNHWQDKCQKYEDKYGINTFPKLKEVSSIDSESCITTSEEDIKNINDLISDLSKLK